MSFIGTHIVTKGKIIFEIEDVESCEQKLDVFKSPRGQNISISQPHVFLKSGEELIVKNAVYDEIVRNLK